MKNLTSRVLNRWGDLRLRLFLEGILIGLLAGLVIVFYRIMLEKAEYYRTFVFSFAVSAPAWFIALLFCILTLIGYLLGVLVRKDRHLSGSGIPQVKGVLLSQLKMKWLNIILGKFVGGVLAIGSGLSLGREGPSVQIGAAVGQGVSRILGRLRIEEKYLITSGASAGLAAAFNAPLAGVIFALEELHKNFSPIVLLSAMAASLTADFISLHFFGLKPIFHFQNLPVLPLNQYPYLIPLGIIIGLFGVIFNSTLIKTMDLYKRIPIPREVRPILPLLTAGVLGFVLPEALGGGHHLINALGIGNMALTSLLILLGVKFVFTMFSYGSGVPGGIFLPLLVIGALSGNILGEVFSQFLNLSPDYVNNFIVLSMAAYFTAIVRAPITASILITEMTGSFSHLLAMAIVSMLAYLTADLIKSRPIYEVLLERILMKNDIGNYLGGHQNKAILECAVSLGSQLDGKRIKDITWPSDCLLVGIKRGENEIIPKGSNRIHVGDYLIVLANEDREGEIRMAIMALAGEREL